MSARRLTRCAALAAVLGLVAAGPAWAQDSILVRVGGDLAAPLGSYVDIPVTADLSGAPGRLLGAYRVTLDVDPSVLLFNDIGTSGFAPPSVNYDSAYTNGRLRITAVLPSGASGTVLLFTIRFSVIDTTTPSGVTLAVDELTASLGSATPFEDLTPLARVVGGTFCGAIGRWGDVDGDLQANSRDALVALSTVVGLTAPPLMNPALADVDADGVVTSRDALIILSHAVGLPVPGYRVMLPAASAACATGSAVSLVVTPSALDLTNLQQARVTVTARDSAGRAVALSNLVWRSLDPGVAAYDANSDAVEGRSPGTTSLIAELGPGVADTITVTVLPRRPVWYVDVRRARNVVTQTGSLAYPLEFIGDAAVNAQDGDTVRVAGGVYEEVITEDRALVLLGDSTDRPIIDPRGSPFFSSGEALDLDGGGTPQVLAHFVFRGGGANLRGSDLTVRWVHFDSAGNEVLRLTSRPDPGSSATGPGVFGNVLVDSVSANDFSQYGVIVEQADTVIVRNTLVNGRLTDSESCSGGYVFDPANILVQEAGHSRIHDNVIMGGPCYGIAVFQSQGRTVIQRNRVSDVTLAGIAARAPVIATDRNVLRMNRGNSYYDERQGIWIPRSFITGEVVADSVISTADTVVDVENAYAHAIRIDTGAVAVIDQLVADSIGQDTSFVAAGVSFRNTRVTLTNSRITRAGRAGVEAIGRAQLISRNNRFRFPGYGVRVVGDFSNGQADSVVIVGDSIYGARSDGVSVTDARFVRVDSTTADSLAGTGVDLSTVRRAMISRSAVRRALNGVAAVAVDTLTVAFDTLQNNANLGLHVSTSVDSVRVRQSIISDNGTTGLNLSSLTARVDSSVVTGSGADGLAIGFSGSAGVRVRATRFQGNGVTAGTAVRIYGGTLSSVIRQSRIDGNVNFQGARNDAQPGAQLDADSVYWGGAFGPRCPVAVTACDPSAAGTTADSVLTLGISFANPLTGPPVTPAPPAFRPAPIAASRSVPAMRPDVRRQPPPRLASRPAPGARPAASRPRAQRPRWSWQRGRQPRPPAPPRGR